MPGSHGVDDATSDANIIDTWWRANPDANIGLACGDLFDVIDIDTESAWSDFKSWGAERGIDWHVYPRVKTGKGGHVYVAASDVRNSAGRRPGIDVRGVGGYVLAPPSVHPNGDVYTWTRKPDGPFLPFPTAEFVAKPVRAAARVRAATTAASERIELAYGIKAREDECEAVRTAPEGERNVTLNTAAFKLAQLVAGGDLDEHTTRDMLRDAALAAGLDDGSEPDEIEATLASAFGAGSTQPRSAPPSTPRLRTRSSRGAQPGRSTKSDTSCTSRPVRSWSNRWSGCGMDGWHWAKRAYWLVSRT